VAEGNDTDDSAVDADGKDTAVSGSEVVPPGKYVDTSGGGGGGGERTNSKSAYLPVGVSVTCRVDDDDAVFTFNPSFKSMGLASVGNDCVLALIQSPVTLF
jgi:hypothetical protein